MKHDDWDGVPSLPLSGRCVQGTWRADTCRQLNDLLMDTSGHVDAPAACIVTENASKKEGHAEKERHPWSVENVGNPVRKSAGSL